MMKSAVSIWALVAYGSVAALTYTAADRVFAPRSSAPLQDDGGAAQSEPASPPTQAENAPQPMSEDEERELLEGVEGFDPDTVDPDGVADAQTLERESAAVEEILSELELIYEDSGDDFIPTQPISPDTTIDFPVDI